MLASSRRRSWGSLAPFAGLLPHPAGRRITARPPPTCLLHPYRPARLIFVGLISPRFERGTMRANVRQNRGKSGCWLLGNSFCGPYPPASFSSPANRSCLGLLPLAGLAGTRRAVHSCGLDPARITCPREPPGLAGPAIRSWVWAVVICSVPPSLQRIAGTNAWPPRRDSSLAAANSLSEVLHRP